MVRVSSKFPDLNDDFTSELCNTLPKSPLCAMVSKPVRFCASIKMKSSLYTFSITHFKESELSRWLI